MRPNQSTWTTGKIVNKVSDVIFDLETETGKQVRRHSNQIKAKNSRNSLPFSISVTEESNVLENKVNGSDSQSVPHTGSEQSQCASQTPDSAQIVNNELENQRYDLRPRR